MVDQISRPAQHVQSPSVSPNDASPTPSPRNRIEFHPIIKGSRTKAGRVLVTPNSDAVAGSSVVVIVAAVATVVGT
ncbi:hypothetical protein BASA61_001204 [Batrachochytrium salamandrivorans]|nr:hypothetical protein BASA60_002287 [Batrachochytrium salamandrivorans]KAH6602330.1 hypothetical protein BASA61_001204 [Batrachochytrium salamandrivorans]